MWVIVRFHIVYKPDNPLLRKDNKFTLLHAAIRYNLENIVEALLKVKGVNVDVEDLHEWTSLHWAAYYGHVDLVKALVENGANSLLKNENGNTPRDLAKDDNIKNFLKEAEEIQLRKRVALKKSIFYGGVIALLGTTTAVALFATGAIAVELIPIVIAVAAIVATALVVGSATYMMSRPSTEVKASGQEMHNINPEVRKL